MLVYQGMIGIGLAVLFAWGPAKASEDKLVCDLYQCINYALDRSSLGKLAQVEIEAADAAIQQSKSAFLPQLNLKLNFAEFNGEPVGFFSVNGVTEEEILNSRINWGEYASLTVNLDYPIYTEGSLLGKDAPSTELAQMERKRKSYSALESREEIIYFVTKAYLDAVSTREKVVITENLVRLSEKQLNVILREVALKLKSPHEAEVAKADFSLQKQILVSAQQAADEALVYLSHRVGIPVTDQLSLDETYPALPKLLPIDQLMRRTETEHTQIAMQRTMVDRSRANLLVSRSHRWPTVALESSYTFADDFDLPGNNLFVTLLKLEVPLYDFGEIRSDVIHSQSLLRAEEMRLETVRENIQAEILKAYSAINEAESRIAVIDQEILKALAVLRSIRLHHEQGLVGPLSVFDAESHLLELQQTLSDARQEQRQRYAELQKSSGGIWKWIP